MSKRSDGTIKTEGFDSRSTLAVEHQESKPSLPSHTPTGTKMKFLISILLLIAAASAIETSNAFNQVRTHIGPAQRQLASDDFHFENFESLRENQSITQVIALMGRTPSVQRHDQAEDLKFETLAWSSPRHDVIANFQDGHLKSYLHYIDGKLTSKHVSDEHM